jgi:glutaryl-CoA dehydrogenase
MSSAKPMKDPLDLLDFSSTLTDEEREIQATVAKFLADRVRPHIGEWFENTHFARELAPELGKLGVLGMHLDGYGCAGTNAVSYGLACLELEAADSGFRSFVSVQGSLSMFSIWKWGSEEQKQEWLPRLAAGEIVLQGEIVLELDDGHRTHLAAGDIVIQNGTRHGWRNRSDRPATMAFVLVGAERDG